MSKRIILLLVKLLVVSMPLIILSKTYANSALTAKEVPIEIQSDTAEFDDKQGRAIYHGHVIMEQGNHQVTSDILVILKDKNGKIDSMLASGNPAQFMTQSEGAKSPTTGLAEIITYFPKPNTLHLQHNASVSQNGDTITGDYLIYDLNSRVLSSNPIPGKRTKIFLTTKES